MWYVLFVIMMIIILAFYWANAIMSDSDTFLVKYGGVVVDVKRPKLSEQRTLQQPFIQYAHAKPDKLYTVMLVDPTAPRPDPINPNDRHIDDGVWRHWLIVDIPGKVLIRGTPNLDGAKGNVISEYQGPKPPAGSGRHTYNVYLYEQLAGKLPGATERVRPIRRNWDIETFVKDYNLHLLSQKTFTVMN